MRLATLTLALLAVTGTAAFAATPAPAPTRVNVESVQPKSLLPKKPLHTEWVVEINKYGQVTRVRSGKPSTDAAYNAHTYGNALQMFIRTADNKAIAGVYRVTYDYNPQTARIRRNVEILHPGGVNANAPGAANVMMAVARKNAQKAQHGPSAATPPPASAAAPLATINPKRLPDLPQVMKTPSP
ncbi:MAG: hypothetical protein ABR975_07085 [Vulcanimicrobiaceae bacterium]